MSYTPAKRFDLYEIFLHLITWLRVKILLLLISVLLLILLLLIIIIIINVYNKENMRKTQPLMLVSRL